MKDSVKTELKPAFDPDFSPQHESNREAARVRGLKYNPKKRSYVDVEGSLVRDEFGQSY